MKEKGCLVFFCGKMGAGKSTQAKQMAEKRNAVLLSEDVWLAALYPNLILSFKDYLTYSARLKPLIREHVQNILSTGTNVVMDFPANTVVQRKWFLSLVAKINAPHEFFYLDVSDEQCLKRIAQRRKEEPTRAAFDTESVFHQVTKYFEVPTLEEGLNWQNDA